MGIVETHLRYCSSVWLLLLLVLFFSELCWGKATVAYTQPQQWQKEESERLRGEIYQTKFIDIGFERWKVVRFRKARGMIFLPGSQSVE